MRFDYRGMGDSSGDLRTFENVNQDIRAAIDRFFEAVPDLTQVVLWGLCDAATASLCYAVTDKRVRGVVLLNPWVRSEAGEAKAYLKHYYIRRVADRSFWRKALAGQLDLRSSIASFSEKLVRAARSDAGAHDAYARMQHELRGIPNLAERIAAGLERFEGEALIILSENDLVAKEFADASESMERLRRALQGSRVRRASIAEATHTFSSRRWRDDVAARTVQWVRSL